MRSILPATTMSLVTICVLSACGGGDGYYDDGPLPVFPVSYVGTTGVFVASADPDTGEFSAASPGSYAGKRQILRGTLDFLTDQDLQQPSGVEIYKGNDGHIYALDLIGINGPNLVQLSTEAAATVDATCSLSGTAVAGANTDYVGVYFTADLVNPVNSSYFYRLPGSDGTCNTADDLFHLVKTGMLASDAPIAVSAMPLATVRTSLGGISGFVIKSGASLVLVDSNFANPVVLGTFPSDIGVASAVAVGTTQGYPTGQLYVVDGNLVYVDYVAHSISAPLYTIPNWTPTAPGAVFAASPTATYFAVNTPGTSAIPASATLYALPSDGSAAPTVVDTEAGRISELQYPVQSSALVFGVESLTYAIRALPASSGSALTLATTSGSDGTFTATATNVYYTFWTASNDTSTHVITHSGTQSGIVAVNGTVVQPPLANSSFVSGGEQASWPNDTSVTQTPYVTLFQLTNLTPVTVTDATSGTQYIEDGVSGATLTSVDATSNQIVATIGSLPVSTAVSLTGTFRGIDDTGFLEATNPLSTQDPATRDLYLVNATSGNTLERVTNDL